MEKIIFNIISSNAHTWVRYWKTEKISGIDLPGEYVELRSNYLSGTDLQELLDAGFIVDKITTQKINADAYCDILLKRKV